MMQALAMFTMLIDHIGIVFFSDSIIWRVLGRIAFPLYAWGIVQGYLHTRSLKRYMSRLTVVAIAAQVPYMVMVAEWKINVVGTFLAVICLLWILDYCKRQGVSKFNVSFVILLGILCLEILPFDYGSYAFVLILLYRFCSFGKMVAGHVLLNLIYPPLFGWSLIQIFSIVPTLIIYFPSIQIEKIRVPRWLWLSFYPTHILILVVLGGVING